MADPRAILGNAVAYRKSWLMYAKAVQGMSAEDAVKWADGELKQVYES